MMFQVKISLRVVNDLFVIVAAPIYLFAPLNFRTRLFNLALIFAVLVCASLCFARFVRRLISGATRIVFTFLPSSSVLVFYFILGSEAIGRFIL